MHSGHRHLLHGLGLCLLLSVLGGHSLAAQELELAPRLSAVSGREISLAADLRVHVGSSALAGFGGVGFRLMGYSCAEFCDMMSGRSVELIGGLRYRRSLSERVSGYLSGGGGVLLWGERWSPLSGSTSDPFAAFEGGWQFDLNERDSLVLGGHILVASEGDWGGTALFYGAVAGLAFQLNQ